MMSLGTASELMPDGMMIMHGTCGLDGLISPSRVLRSLASVRVQSGSARKMIMTRPSAAHSQLGGRIIGAGRDLDTLSVLE
jgi:hypothetical protein